MFNCFKYCLCKSCLSGIVVGEWLCSLSIILLLLILLSGDVEVNPGPSRNLMLNVGHINARSLNVEDKFDEITSLVVEQQLSIFAVSETWLNSGITGDLLCIPGFSPMFRLDRSDGRKAGVLPYTSHLIIYLKHVKILSIVILNCFLLKLK